MPTSATQSIETLLAAVSSFKLRPAPLAARAERLAGASKVPPEFWSVSARVRGARLEVFAHQYPEVLNKLTHVKPVTVALAKRDDAGGLLRLAATALRLPAGARGIPFGLLEGGSANTPARVRYCGLALPRPVTPKAILVGNQTSDGDIPLEMVVLSGDQVIAVGLDEYSSRFGRVSVERPLSRLANASVDKDFLSLDFGARKPLLWRLAGNNAQELRAAKALLKTMVA